MTTPNEKLRRARLEKRWSIAVASRRVGVSTNTFSHWERGLQNPQLTTLDQLMETFEMSAEDLGFGHVLSPLKRTTGACAEVAGQEASRALSPAMQEIDLPWPASSFSYSGEGAKPPHVQPAASAQVEEEQLSRRQMIAALIGTPAAVFCARQGDNLSLLRVEEILTLCASHIPLCCQLYFEGGQAEVERVLPYYITQLSTLARYPSSYQKRAATLLSQAHQLAALLAIQRQDYGAASTSARQARSYGEVAGDPNLQLTSSVRQAQVGFYLKRSRQSLLAYQAALQLAPQTSPLLQGRIYIGLAETYSRLKQEDEARHFLELARQVFPERAEDDPNYVYTHFSCPSTSLFEGMMHLNFEQPERAWQEFERVSRAIPQDPVPLRLELTVRQAATACALGELELTCQLLQTAVPLARTLGSPLRVDESYGVYERMLEKWDGEAHMQKLEELFR